MMESSGHTVSHRVEQPGSLDHPHEHHGGGNDQQCIEVAECSLDQVSQRQAVATHGRSDDCCDHKGNGDRQL